MDLMITGMELVLQREHHPRIKARGKRRHHPLLHNRPVLLVV
jgi:hypothetical protein